MRKTEEEQQEYEKLQTNEELVDFHNNRSSTAQGFTEEEVKRAEEILTDCFAQAEQILGDHEWLVDDKFTLADIAWIPLHFTLIRAEFSFDQFPAVNAWANRISEKASFRKGVVDWWPAKGLDGKD